MDNITNNRTEQAAEVTEGKYTYGQLLTILETFSDDELAIFGQCTLNELLGFLNNPNGIENMMENCKANINAAFVEIALIRKLEKAMSENPEPAETEEPKEPEEKEEEATPSNRRGRSVNWYYPSAWYDYGRRNPHDCTSALSWF